MSSNKEYIPYEDIVEAIMYGVKDKLPKGELCINDSIIQNTLGCDDVGFDERREFINRLNLDIFTISPSYSCSKHKLATVENYFWPDIKKWTRDTSLFIFGIVDGAFESGLRTLGFQEFFHILRTPSSNLKEFIKSVEELNIALIRNLANEGVKGIILADDVAYQKGLLANPKILREYFLPSLERQVKVVEGLGLQPFYHSDGNYGEIIEDLINAGFVGLHCIDKNSGMDILDLQYKVDNRLCLWGHLSINDINEVLSKADLENLTAKIDELSHKKRFILGTNSGLFDGINLNTLKLIYKSL